MGILSKTGVQNLVYLVLKIPPPATLEVQTTIKTLSKPDYSYSRIIREVKGQGFALSKSLISKLLNNNGKKRAAVAAGLPPPPKRQPLKVLDSTVLRKINLLTSKENPPTQKQFSSIVKVSKSSLGRAIKTLKKIVRRKTRMHQLTEKHKKIVGVIAKNFMQIIWQKISRSLLWH